MRPHCCNSAFSSPNHILLFFSVWTHYYRSLRLTFWCDESTILYLKIDFDISIKRKKKKIIIVLPYFQFYLVYFFATNATNIYIITIFFYCYVILLNIKLNICIEEHVCNIFICHFWRFFKIFISVSLIQLNILIFKESHIYFVFK